MSIPEIFPILTNLDKNKKKRMWRIIIDTDKESYYTVYGLVDGKKQESKKTKAEAKNIKKSNATSIKEQCLYDAHSTFINKILDGMEIDIEINKLENINYNVEFFNYRIEKFKKGGNKNESFYDLIEYTKNSIPKVEKDTEEHKNNQTEDIKEHKNNQTEDTKEHKKKYEIKFPMLAETFNPNENKRLKNLGWDNNKKNNVFVDTKLDGMRCIAFYNNDEDKVIFYSREGKNISHLLHIKEELKNFFKKDKYKNLYLDGELYTHELPEEYLNIMKNKNVYNPSRMSFIQKICSVGRKEAVDEKLEKYINYIVYDIIDYDKTMLERNKIITDIFNDEKFNYVKKVIRYETDNWNSTYPIFEKIISDGYEGLILRVQNAKYESTRTTNLQKYKEFKTNEALIIDVIDGKGKDEKLAIFVCKLENGKTFKCRIATTEEERRKQFLNANEYIENTTYLTYKYFELSEDGIPRFPVGIAIRNYE